MSVSVVVINGPSLNLLGQRDPAFYGTDTLGDIERLCRVEAERLGLDVEFFQSNHEGALIDRVQEAFTRRQAVVINAAGYSHTSIALMDALELLSMPVVEVHLSDINSREEFRRHSYISLVAAEVIVGKGGAGYLLALQQVARLTNRDG